ncbi:MAG: GNAT family N-acetyltransferase [Actinomycetia bacterium]|nr:GNAT family N-acetyltransferase [Actinomycetes bacterium]
MTTSRSRATKGLEVEIIENPNEAEELVEDWTTLAVGAGPLALPSFALAWWHHLGRGRLQLVVVRNGAGSLVGLAPLHLRRLGPISVLRWLGHGLGPVGELLVGEAKGDVAGAIWNAVSGPDRVLDLTHYRHGGAGLDSLRQGDQWAVHASLADQCPTIELAGIESAVEYLSSPERRGLRKKLARVDRDLEDARAELEVRVVTDPGRVHSAIAEIDPIYDAAERAHPRLHLLTGHYRPFAIEAFAEAARVGQLALMIASIDGCPIAFDVYVRTGNVASAWLGRFAPTARTWSPGHLLLRAGLEWATTNGLSTIDLQLGADEYKRRWATDAYDTLQLVAAADRRRLVLGRAIRHSLEVGHGARVLLRSGPPPAATATQPEL